MHIEKPSKHDISVNNYSYSLWPLAAVLVNGILYTCPVWFCVVFRSFSPLWLGIFPRGAKKENANAWRMPNSRLGTGGVFLALD